MSFSDNLREALDFKDFQIKELASKTGISKNTIDNYLSGQKSIPSAQNALKIAKALDVSVEFLVNGDTSKSSTNSILSQKQKLLLQSFEKLNSLEQNAIIQLIDNLIKAKQ